MHGNQAAIWHFSKAELKTNSVQTWKQKYQAEVARRQKGGETGDMLVRSLPAKKRGKPCGGKT